MTDTGNNEQDLPLRIYKCKESEEYARRIMALSDIVFSIECLIRLEDMNRLSGGDDLVREALWNSAVIRAFSIFDGPNAIKLEILDALPEGAKEVYRFFKNYRNKHIGHKVNPVDQVKAGILLSEQGTGKKEVVGIGHLAMQDASFSDQEMIDSLGRFLNELKKQVEKEVAFWGEQVFKAATDDDIERLYELEPLRVVVPHGGYLQKGTLASQ